MDYDQDLFKLGKKTCNENETKDLILNEKIWNKEFLEKFKKEVSNNIPYSFGVIDDLIDGNKLKKLRQEVLENVNFTSKETDIYKINQSGDLSNLKGLENSDLEKLSTLNKLKKSIYSQKFRNIISDVLGCGKLSGVKIDMSINIYTKGSYLLIHDDAIGTRKVSFILYLTNPDKKWREHYGGSLRLYDSISKNIPSPDHCNKIIPEFNRFAFFSVVPGLSFHDVEEVKVDKKRISIQGWFHLLQKNENFYDGVEEDLSMNLTLSQLQNKQLLEFEFPKLNRNDLRSAEMSHFLNLKSFSQLTDDDITYLSKYIDLKYLFDFDQIYKKKFFESSVIELKNFLNIELSNKLHNALLNSEMNNLPVQLLDDFVFPWKCAIPSYKQKFMYIDGKSSFVVNEKNIVFKNKVGPQENFNFEMLKSFIDIKKNLSEYLLTDLASFFTSIAFKKWLCVFINLIPTSENIIIRRFRQGMDFTLATAPENVIGINDELNLYLEGNLNLTPTAINPSNWENENNGGYELYMNSNVKNEDGNSHTSNDDPAVYSSKDNFDDSVLFCSKCKWNSFILVLRDPSVLKFVKYLSSNAKGSRWDISLKWNLIK